MAKNITVSVGNRQHIDLKIGGTETTVEVSDIALQIQTESSQRDQTITNQQTEGLPLVNRNYTDLLATVTGVRQAPTAATTSSNLNALARQGAYNVNGQRSVFNNFLLDGMDNNSYGESKQGFDNQMISVPLDSVARFSVVTNNESAEYGRSSGATINVASLSGGNRFHGTIYVGRQTTNPQFQNPSLLDPKINHTWVKGNHSLKFAYEWEKVWMGVLDNNPLYGRYAIGGGYSAPAGTTKVADTYFAVFLFGLSSSYALSNYFEAHLRETLQSTYAQDDWKPHSNLTLSLGLRWEYGSPYSEKNNFISNFDPTSQTVLTKSPGAVAAMASRLCRRAAPTPRHWSILISTTSRHVSALPSRLRRRLRFAVALARAMCITRVQARATSWLLTPHRRSSPL